MKKLFEKYRELIVYVFFGVLTTLVNYIIHFSLSFLGANYYICVSVAWLGAVIFAYATNRIFVFDSKTKGKAQIKEAGLFFSARVFSYGIEMLIAFIFIGCLHLDKIVWTVSFSEAPLPLGEFIVKTVSQVIIVISNYVFSKLVIFKKEK
jgi:putative flippase GtrA